MIAELPLSLELRRRLAASPERVFRAWTEPELVRQWWRMSEQHRCVLAEIDLRVGGTYRMQVEAPGGASLPVITGTYQEVTPPRRLVFTWRWAHHPMEKETLVTVEFLAADSGCELVIRHERFPDVTMRNQHEEGWCAVLAMLERSTSP